MIINCGKGASFVFNGKCYCGAFKPVSKICIYVDCNKKAMFRDECKPEFYCLKHNVEKSIEIINVKNVAETSLQNWFNNV